MPTDKRAGARKRAATPAKSQKDLVASLQRYIKAKGDQYLADPNITSVGVGYKQVNGKPSNEVALVFTVDEKAQPEALAALNTNVIPETISVDGIEVATDVLQRSYKPGFRLVSASAPPEWKTRLDPIEPGISVANINVTAGTIGCIVYDRADGTPYILSNWHVLQGPSGQIGDIVVQPGPMDDNRTRANRLGKLVRSHLGTAGDCAIASIEDRGFKSDILKIGVTPTALGEAELGDKVVKFGRTTQLTHGVVRRVGVLASLDYGSAGTKNISAFEIGLDPKKAPADGEVSAGGDSGAAWMFKGANGKVTPILAGLHFGGESGGSADEHALACDPKSVFEKLGITLDRPSDGPENATSTTGKGYDPNFLAEPVAAPKARASIKDDISVAKDGSDVLHYTHFSLSMRASRKFAAWVAWNIDGSAIKLLSRKNLDFVKDKQLDLTLQIGNELYQGNRLDRGHIARRADVVWGPLEEAQRANADSFYYTNITPQIEDFNQSTKNGLWGLLENAVFEDADVDDLKVSVFGGPVFNADDRLYRDTKLPREFWKVIVFVEKGVLKARGFLLTQNLEQLEVLDLDEFRVYQRPLTEIEQRTQLIFPRSLKRAELPAAPEVEASPLASLAEIRW